MSVIQGTVIPGPVVAHEMKKNQAAGKPTTSTPPPPIQRMSSSRLLRSLSLKSKSLKHSATDGDGTIMHQDGASRCFCLNCFNALRSIKCGGGCQCLVVCIHCAKLAEFFCSDCVAFSKLNTSNCARLSSSVPSSDR